jgi:hypothetical protein
MDMLYDELVSPTRMIPWEYQETAEKFGTGFLEKNFSATLAVPTAAEPDIATWVTSAAGLGVGKFAVPDEKLTPRMWKRNPLFDTACMGMRLQEAISRLLRTRFPFAAAVPRGGGEIEPPERAEDLEQFLRDR